MQQKKTRNKVVILAVSDDSAFKIPLEETFRKLGHKVILFNYRKTSYFEKFIFLLSFFIKSWKAKNIEMLNQRLVELVGKNHAQILFVSKGELITPSTIEKINQLGVITINWFPDLFMDYQIMMDTLSKYNYVLTPNREDVRKYQGRINAFHLPCAGYFISQKPNFKNRKYEISFIGTWSKKREEMMYTLRRFNPAIWGNKLWFKSRMKDFYQGKWLTPPEVLEKIQASKIIVNTHYVDSKIGTTLNMRAFETTANGALLITDYRKDLSKLFRIEGESKEVVCYQDIKELKKLVEFYLKNDKERIKIAKRGFKRIIKEHTYIKRIKGIFSLILKN